MLSKFSPPLLLAIANAGYADEVLALPLVDATSPPPSVRVTLLRTPSHGTATFMGATPAYMAVHRPTLLYCNSPFDAVLVPWLATSIVHIEADHVAWTRAAKSSRLTFQYCEFSDVLALVVESNIKFSLCEIYDRVAWLTNDTTRWSFHGLVVVPDDLQAMVKTMGGRYSGVSCKWDWLPHTHA